MKDTVILHAKERGAAPANAPHSARPMKVVLYDAVIIPRKPVKIGQRVCISNLTKMPDRYTGPYKAPPQYESMRTDIAGKVTGVRVFEKGFTEFIVECDVPSSLVRTACVAIPHIEGVTVEISGWYRLARMLLLPLLPETRRIPLEIDAIILPDDLERECDCGVDDGGDGGDGGVTDGLGDAED
ncbi:hypothetical protein FKP32DRAFT_1567561 [Trametes sanguinea]|nr:hypothetical protein FKP32DRAFT_1567561 [Trametes sanguinea]